MRHDVDRRPLAAAPAAVDRGPGRRGGAVDAAWLGWDQQYDIEPATGNASGPYQAWQVVGCVVTLAVLATVAGLLRRPGLAVAIVPGVFTALWARDAARVDGSGLWLVGAVMLAGGSLGGVAAVAHLADGVRRWRASAGSRRESTRPCSAPGARGWRRR